METNALNQFQGNAITFAEMRKELGRTSDDTDTSQLFANMIQQPNALALIQAKLGGTSSNTEENEEQTSKSASANTGTSGPDKNQDTQSKNKTASATVQPSNQHGTTTMNVKEAYENIHNSTAKNIENYQKNFESVYKKFRAARNDICERNAQSSIVLSLTRDTIQKELLQKIQAQAVEGINKAVKDSKSDLVPNKKLTLKLLDDNSRKTLDSIFKDINSKLKRAKTKDEKLAAFDSVEYRLRFLSEYIVDKAYWFAYVKTCAQFKIPEVYVNFSKTEDSDKHSYIIKTNAFSLDDIPPYHAYCTCNIINQRK